MLPKIFVCYTSEIWGNKMNLFATKSTRKRSVTSLDMIFSTIVKFKCLGRDSKLQNCIWGFLGIFLYLVRFLKDFCKKRANFSVFITSLVNLSDKICKIFSCRKLRRLCTECKKCKILENSWKKLLICLFFILFIARNVWFFFKKLAK